MTHVPNKINIDRQTQDALLEKQVVCNVHGLFISFDRLVGICLSKHLGGLTVDEIRQLMKQQA
jgi:DNA-binding transcriptional regulator LsrR (DeoR family)